MIFVTVGPIFGLFIALALGVGALYGLVRAILSHIHRHRDGRRE